jgi:acyl-CoA synthetase (AMP-forming)/AMP-acid ligase II
MSLVKVGINQGTSDALALADERISYTWATLDPVLNRLVNALIDTSWSRERRAGVFSTNSAEAVLVHAGCILAGVSSTPINYHLTVDELAYILTDSASSVLFLGPETLDIGCAAAIRAGIGMVVAWRCAPTPGVISWEDWVSRASSAEPLSDMIPRPHMHYTSGTTGRPKATETPPTYFPPANSIAEWVSGQRERSSALPAGPGIAVGPLYHTGPLTMVRALVGGVPLVTRDSFDPEKCLAAIETFKIASTVMVPTHFQRLLALPQNVRSKYDVTSIKRLAHTGAACPRDVKQQMIDWFGPVLVEAYGGTESGTTNMITSAEWLERPGSVGKAIAPFEMVIVDEQGAVLGPNQPGRVFFRDRTGRGIIFSNDPEKTAQAHIEPGVFTLGEVGYVDEAGYLFITDRVSDMIVSGGVNIYPAEAEQILLRHPEVADVAVVGAPNKEMGEEVKALVVARDPARPPGADELNAFCRQSLAGYKCPRSYDFVSDIGRNIMGKVNKRELKKKYWPTERMIGG